MIKYCLYFASFLAAAYAAGELVILHSPASINFKGNEKLEQSILKEVYSASLGFTTEKSSSWSGMYILDPFHYPEAVVNVAVEGVSFVANSELHGPRFPLKTDEEEVATWTALEERVQERYPDGNNSLVRIELSQGLDALELYPSLLQGIKVQLSSPADGDLQLDVDEDRKFLEELALLNAITDKVKSGAVTEDYNQDVWWFVVSSLHALTDLHGEDSKSVVQAHELLSQALNRLSRAFSHAYNGRVLITAMASDASHTRRTRSLKQGTDDSQFGDWNLAKQYDANYPVIFNIILWFGVIFVFSMLAICIFIATMDPGRDSIIYRMTSNRMKKDN